MSAHDPELPPAEGRSIPCERCGQPVALAADSPRLVCGGCGHVNPPAVTSDVTESGSAVPVEAAVSEAGREVPQRALADRQGEPVATALSWGLVGGALPPSVVLLSLALAWVWGGREGVQLGLGLFVGGGVLAPVCAAIAALAMPSTGGNRAQRFLGLVVGLLAAAPVTAGLGFLALMLAWSWSR